MYVCICACVYLTDTHTCIETDRQTHRQAGRQADRQTDRQEARKKERESGTDRDRANGQKCVSTEVLNLCANIVWLRA